MIYHILNGDALKKQLPDDIEGERIVMRECLVDGDIQGETIEQLYKNRAKFISEHYKGYSANDYWQDSVQELNRIAHIPSGSTVYHWFEKDLFCQVNWWFTLYLQAKSNRQTSSCLVLPTSDLQYGFGGMDEADFFSAYTNAKNLNQFKSLLSQLWPLYQQQDHKGLLDIARQLNLDFPFLQPAIRAEIDRYPNEGLPGKPEKLLQEIQLELATKEFGPVFREFTKRGAIYGFGDLQVKRIWDQLNTV